MESASLSISDLICQARIIIQRHSLESVPNLGIGTIQKDLEEVETKIAEARTRRFTDMEKSKFTLLIDYAGRFDNYVVKHLKVVEEVSGITELLDCYVAIQELYQKDLVEIQQIFSSRVAGRPPTVIETIASPQTWRSLAYSKEETTALGLSKPTAIRPLSLLPEQRVDSPFYEKAFENVKAHLQGLANPILAQELASCFKKISQRSINGREGIASHFSNLQLPKDTRLMIEEFDRQIKLVCKTDSAHKLENILEAINDNVVTLSKQAPEIELWHELKDLLSQDEIRLLENDVIKEVLHLIKTGRTDQLRTYMNDNLARIGVSTDEFDEKLESLGKYDLNTVLGEVIDKRPAKTSGIVTHWNKPAEFFQGKTLIFGETLPIGSPSGQIVHCWWVGEKLCFSLDTDFIVEMTSRGGTFAIQVKKQLSSRLYNMIFDGSRVSKNFNLTRSANSSENASIPNGPYQLEFHSLPQPPTGVTLQAKLTNTKTNMQYFIGLCAKPSSTEFSYVIYATKKGKLREQERLGREEFRKAYLTKNEKSSDLLSVDEDKAERLMVFKEDSNEARVKIAQRKIINTVIESVRSSMLEQRYQLLLNQLTDNLISNQLDKITVNLRALPSDITSRLEEASELFRQYFQITRTPHDILKQVVLEAIYAKVEVKKDGLDVANSMALLEQANQQTEKLKGKEGVFFMGDTGSGKSASIAYLSGALMKKTNNPVGDTVFVLSERNKDPSIYPSIGQALGMSETLHAQGYPPVDPKLDAQGVVFVDCAGFNDTRGTEWELCANLSVDEAVSQVREIRSLVAVCPFSAIVDDRANKIIDLILTIQERFPGTFIPGHADSISVHLVITKAPDTTPEAYKNLGTRIFTHISEIEKLLADQDGHTRRSLEDKKGIWQVLQQMHTNQQVHLIDLLNRKTKEDLINRICKNHSTRFKASYRSAMDTYNLRKKFGDIIEESTETWVNIFHEYRNKTPRLIQEKKTDINQRMQRLKELDIEKEQRTEQIVQYKQQIAALEAFIAEIKSARAKPTEMTPDLYKLLEVKERDNCQKELDHFSRELGACQKKVGLYEETVRALDAEVSYIEKANITYARQTIEALKKELVDLSTGQQDVPLQTFEYKSDATIECLLLKDENTRKVAFSEVRHFREDEIKERKKYTLSEYEGVMSWLTIIDRDFKLIPTDAKMQEEFNQAILASKTSGTYTSGTYAAKLEGDRFSPDLGFNAEASGKKVAYSFNTHWKRGSSFPWIKITHSVPKIDYNAATIANKAAQLVREEAELVRLNDRVSTVKGDLKAQTDEVIRNADIMKRLYEKIDSLKKKLQNETGRISTRIEALLKEQEEQLQKKRAENAHLEKSRDIEEKMAKVDQELYELQKALDEHIRVKHQLAITIKTKWSTVDLLRKFANLALSGSEKMPAKDERGKGILTVCQQFITVYDAYKDVLLKECITDLRL